MEKIDLGHVLGRELGVRILYAHMLLSEAEDEHIALAVFGERVAAEERRILPAKAAKKSYSASTISRWESGESEPDQLLTLLAITSLVNRAMKSARRTDRLDPGWLAFGEASGASAPKIPTFTLSDFADMRSGGRRSR